MKGVLFCKYYGYLFGLINKYGVSLSTYNVLPDVIAIKLSQEKSI